MPLIEQSTYKPPFGFKNPHIQSIFPQTFRSVRGIVYSRERITTPDNDFLDIDWCKDGNSRCAILVHGLEGHSKRAYMLGMVRALRKKGWDTVSMNHRGCSGEPNRFLRSYHHGTTDDLYTVIAHVLNKNYREITIIGFSLGGNNILKYLGERLFPIPKELSCSVAISTPCDLVSCARKMDQKSSEFYAKRFIRMLHKKLIEKKKIFPDKIDDHGVDKMTRFREFDTRFTAPIHGFQSPDDYYTKAGCLPFLGAIEKPSLLINAKDDVFLTPQCFPVDIARKSNCLYFEAPDHGGHVGFIAFNKENEYWHEIRTVAFVEEFCFK